MSQYEQRQSMSNYRARTSVITTSSFLTTQFTTAQGLTDVEGAKVQIGLIRLWPSEFSRPTTGTSQ